MKIRETGEGSVLEVSVKPKSGGFNVVVDGDDVVVFCRSEPLKGRVNRELIKEFSRFFHTDVELVSGFASKQKKLLIRNVGKNRVEALLRQG
jgi:uncharacterized protein (TIGR00251 family)